MRAPILGGRVLPVEAAPDPPGASSGSVSYPPRAPAGRPFGCSAREAWGNWGQPGATKRGFRFADDCSACIRLLVD